MGKVKKWVMSPEQLAEYLEKYPIRKKPDEKKHFENARDYRWPGAKKAKAAKG